MEKKKSNAGIVIAIIIASVIIAGGAVAAALMRAQGESDEAIWASRDYVPNPYVYKICCRTFGLE